MPIPLAVGRLNKAGLNRLTRRIAPWAPGLGVVVHRGRRSGRAYETPVSVFPTGDGYMFALTYGPGTDWVIPGCRTTGVPGGDHLLPLRVPDLVAETIEQFAR
jgi:hypothetical protein